MATTTTAAQDAVERAKSIAARLSGDANATTTTTSAKRKRWGDAPDAASTTAATSTTDEILPGLNAAKKLKDSSEGAVQKRVWVSTSKKPAAHFVAYLSERLVAMKESASSSSQDNNLVMQLKGRGSSKEPPVPGMPEEPLHVFLEGPAAVVANLESQVELLIQEAEDALLLEDNTEDDSKATALLTDGTDHPTAAATTSSSSGYKPASVAQLIGQALVPNAVKNGGHYGPNGGGGGDSVELLEEQIAVPNGVVGFVIGRGGETISSLQAKSGAKIQIQKEHEVPPGQGHRVITLIAQTKEAIDACRTMIEAMVQDRIRSNTNSNGNSNNSNSHHHHHGGGGGGNNNNSGTTPQEQKVQEALAMGHQLVQILVPDADVGLIIGKMGSTIQSIQDRSGGASIQIPPHGDADNPTMRTVSITHPTMEGANMARQIIEDILKSKPSFANQHQQQQSQQGPQITVQVTIPDKDVGLCIGRQGCVIREMQHKTNTRIQIPSQPTPGLSYRIATVVGTAEGCALVENLIQRITVEQSSACVMSGTPFNANQANGGGGYGQQQQQQQPYYHQQQGQQQYYADGQQQQQQQQQGEYSPEWAAYYAAQAQAAQQQQAATVTAVAPAAAAAGQPAADAYYDQFFRYAYYYGEEAARAYYSAWSPPVGTPNPYGQNPNGITAAPANGADAAPAAAAPVAAAPVAAAPAAQPAVMNARDTSVRRVSNLPAWMTKSS